MFQASLSSETSGGFGLNASVFRKSEKADLVYIPSVADGLEPENGDDTNPNWIAEWDFNDGGACSPTASGWETADNRIRNDGFNHWSVTDQFGWAPGIDDSAAALWEVNACWVTDFGGYGNDWDYAIKVTYQAPFAGTLRLRFNYYVDSEPGDFSEPIPIAFDALTVEADSLCSSFDLDFGADPTLTAERQRQVLKAFSGQAFVAGHQASGVAEASLPQFSSQTSTTHCVLIRFFSDFGYSPEDSENWGPVAVVIDNLVLELNGIAILTGDFCLPIDPSISFINSSDSEPFGNWARLYQPITDNDVCSENPTCAWLLTDDTTPTLFFDPSLGYGPGGFVIKNWLDQVIVSPWVTFSAQQDERTVLSFTEFGGNAFDRSRITRSWSVRGRDEMGCVSPWPNDEKESDALDNFTWREHLEDISAKVVSGWSQIQLRYRVTDAQFNAPDAPASNLVGPGPFLDNVRIGRIAFTGPIMESLGGRDTRWQAQDAFPTDPAPIGFMPSTFDRYGTCALSPGQDISKYGIWSACGFPGLGTPFIGDSILVKVVSSSSNRSINEVSFYGAIVAGPHLGKAPPPYSVNVNGFFQVNVMMQNAVDAKSGVVLTDVWFADLDDDYFRGGDVLRYFWYAQDSGDNSSSLPAGIVDPLSVSLPEAEQVAGGLFEVNFLPAIDWDTGYLGRIAADPHGKLEPTAQELAGSKQANAILYVNKANFSRRSSNRTSFMYTLDRLGYRNSYDVYDVQGFGNTNNDLGSRACPNQCEGYALIVHDQGTNALIPIPNGTDPYAQKVNQDFWYQYYMVLGNNAEVGRTTLWLIGENIASGLPLTSGLRNLMGFTVVGTGVSDYDVNPQVRGVASFRWADDQVTNFTGNLLQLHGGCPVTRDFDALSPSPPGVLTHRFGVTSTGLLGPGAVVMKSNVAEKWNSIIMSFPWFDLVEEHGSFPEVPTAKTALAGTILSHVLPAEWQEGEDPVDIDDPSLPRQTLLHQNLPNPFNPMTRINFDLAVTSKASLRVYSVAGRLVRTLLDSEVPVGSHSVVWDGKDDLGVNVASGLYVYRLEGGGLRLSRKMVVIR